MNKQSNLYIITYATLLVVIVAAVLSLAAIKLAPIQQKNVEIEKMSDILNSVGLLSGVEGVLDKDAYIKTQYDKYVIESFLVNSKGEKVDGSAFNALRNLKAEYAKEASQRTLPVFICKDDKGVIKYVFPIIGTGLWGPVWGYIALGEDLNSITGAVFDHKSETPGLGAEITTSAFEDQYIGKTIFESDKFVGVKVVKGPGASTGNPHAVDAISGGTITSRAVESMVIGCIKDYEPFILKQRSSN